jgi:hypothetical protein
MKLINESPLSPSGGMGNLAETKRRQTPRGRLGIKGSRRGAEPRQLTTP